MDGELLSTVIHNGGSVPWRFAGDGGKAGSANGGWTAADHGLKYEKRLPNLRKPFYGGAKGIRTPDPLHAMEMRYQLRHSPVELAGFEPATLCLQSRCATSCAIAP